VIRLPASIRKPLHATGVAALAVASSATFLAVTEAARAAAPTTLVVTITNTQVRVAQAPVRVGLVTFKVTNKSKTVRDFRIGGKRTPRIATGKWATLNVNVTKTGLVVYSSAGLSGVLTFIDPCTKPATSTVSVQMSESPIKLSQTSVPCGSVTFAVTNVGTIVHSFRIGNAGTPQIQPGQSSSVTVRLMNKVRVFYSCGEPEHDEMYGETGWIKVV
jgi:hypothetical protein